MFKNQVAVIVVLLAHRKDCVVVKVEHAPIKNMLHGFLEVSHGQLADLWLSIDMELGKTDTVFSRRLWSWCWLELRVLIIDVLDIPAGDVLDV